MKQRMTNTASLEYELGVMMFNAFNTDSYIRDTTDYDIRTNFLNIIYGISQFIDLRGLKPGYMAEGDNHEIIKVSVLEEMFKRDLEAIFK